MTQTHQRITFDKKEFLDFLEWAGVTGEIHTTDSGGESFTITGNFGNIFTLDAISSERDQALEEVRTACLHDESVGYPIFRILQKLRTG